MIVKIIDKKITDSDIWDINEDESDQTLLYKRRRRSYVRGAVLFTFSTLCLPTGMILVLVNRNTVAPVTRYGYLLLAIGFGALLMSCDCWFPRLQDTCVDVIENGDQVATSGGKCLMLYFDRTFVSAPFMGPCIGVCCLLTSVFLLVAYSVDTDDAEVLLGAKITGGVGLVLCILSYKGFYNMLK